MNDIERALSQISDIRDQLAASTRFRGYAPEAVAVVGLASLLVMLAQMLWPERYAASDRQIVLVWGGVLVAGCLAVAIEALARSRSRHGGMAGAMLASVARTIAPVLIIGAVIGLSVLAYAPQQAWIVPGIWQMLTAVVGFYSFSTLPRSIIWPATWYLASGAFVTFHAGQLGTMTPLMAGLPYVIGHLSIAWILRREGKSYDC